MITKKHLHEDIEILAEQTLKLGSDVQTLKRQNSGLSNIVERQGKTISLLLEKLGVEVALQPRKVFLKEVADAAPQE